MSSLPAIELVANAFSRAAVNYDSVADLQRKIADGLMQRSTQHLHGKVMDLGCGTGYVCELLLAMDKVTHISAVDVAPGMIDVAQQRLGKQIGQWILADAQTMAVAPQSHDAIVSSLAIQWCADLNGLFTNLYHILKPNGDLCIATLGPNTMHELRTAWQEIDDFQHVNEFVAQDLLEKELRKRFTEVCLQTQTITQESATVTKLLSDLKQLGVSNHNLGARKGLTTRAQLRAMGEAYETQRNRQGQLPLTYEVIYIHAKRPSL